MWLFWSVEVKLPALINKRLPVKTGHTQLPCRGIAIVSIFGHLARNTI
jgi:hypothetical protein